MMKDHWGLPCCETEVPLARWPCPGPQLPVVRFLVLFQHPVLPGTPVIPWAPGQLPVSWWRCGGGSWCAKILYLTYTYLCTLASRPDSLTLSHFITL